MGRGGGGGGSRGGGMSGGSRSSGGRSSSSGSGSRGNSSGRFNNRGSSRGSSHSRNIPHIHHRRTPAPHYRPYGGGYSRHYRGSGSAWATFLTIFIIFIVIRSLFSGFSTTNSITTSTIVREPLDRSYVNETAYYTDTLNWIGNANQLESGMKSFFNQTGVQPYIYITDDDSLANFDRANELYDELFTDEAHFLVVWSDHPDYYTNQTVGGLQTKSVMDSEAIEILLDYLDANYYNQSLSEEQFISNSFVSTADRIMGKTADATGASMVMLVIVVVIIIGTIVIIRLIFNRQKEKAEETERLLNIDLEPLENSTSSDMSELIDKYNDQD